MYTVPAMQTQDIWARPSPRKIHSPSPLVAKDRMSRVSGMDAICGVRHEVFEIREDYATAGKPVFPLSAGGGGGGIWDSN